MAVRSGANASDTSGKYLLNRSLSTPHDDLLAAQGVSWLHRTAISIASVYILITAGLMDRLHLSSNIRTPLTLNSKQSLSKTSRQEESKVNHLLLR